MAVSLVLTPKNKKNKKESRFMPYHHLGLFDRTYNAAENSEGVTCTLLCAATVEALLTDLECFYSYCSENPIVFAGYSNRSYDNYLNEDELMLQGKLKLIGNWKQKASKKEESTNEDKPKLQGDKPKTSKKEESITALKNLSVFGEWDKNEKLYQEYRLLVEIRNGLTHLKPEELILSSKDGDFYGHPKYLNNLLQKKIAKKPAKVCSWIEWIENQEYCLWCQDVTYRIIQRVISMLPKSNLSKYFSEDTYFKFNKEKQKGEYKLIEEKKQKEKEELQYLRKEVKRLQETIA